MNSCKTCDYICHYGKLNYCSKNKTRTRQDGYCTKFKTKPYSLDQHSKHRFGEYDFDH